jgi:hypothetical protein
MWNASTKLFCIQIHVSKGLKVSYGFWNCTIEIVGFKGKVFELAQIRNGFKDVTIEPIFTKT